MKRHIWRRRVWWHASNPPCSLGDLICALWEELAVQIPDETARAVEVARLVEVWRSGGVDAADD